jgi:hypothetical protein
MEDAHCNKPVVREQPPLLPSPRPHSEYEGECAFSMRLDPALQV